MSVPPLPESVEALSKEEIIRHLYTYTELLFTRTSRLAALESHLSCAICTTYFVCPFTLQCGHTFCYNCISAWFDNLQQNEKALRCPTCRADIRLRPHRELVLDRLVEEYLGDLCDPESVELMENVRTTRDALGSMRDPPFHRHMPNNFGNEALLDAEDGVTRCNRCNWEIYNGQCQGCGFVYNDPRDESVYSGSDDELGRLDDESVSNDSFVVDDDYISDSARRRRNRSRRDRILPWRLSDVESGADMYEISDGISDGATITSDSDGHLDIFRSINGIGLSSDDSNGIRDTRPAPRGYNARFYDSDSERNTSVGDESGSDAYPEDFISREAEESSSVCSDSGHSTSSQERQLRHFSNGSRRRRVILDDDSGQDEADDDQVRRIDTSDDASSSDERFVDHRRRILSDDSSEEESWDHRETGNPSSTHNYRRPFNGMRDDSPSSESVSHDSAMAHLDTRGSHSDDSSSVSSESLGFSGAARKRKHGNDSNLEDEYTAIFGAAGIESSDSASTASDSPAMRGAPRTKKRKGRNPV
ncbi:E3 ubiquitin ligase [Gaertneriomyces sp. JEL0708]|nr:E3 ubiquitin ligase [Gaertneriomyces sp. JEL0708]